MARTPGPEREGLGSNPASNNNLHLRKCYRNRIIRVPQEPVNSLKLFGPLSPQFCSVKVLILQVGKWLSG